MGEPRKDNENRLLPLSRKQEMESVAGNRPNAVEPDVWLTFLRDNPQDAKELGALYTLAGRTMREAYPEDTRTNTFSNSAWKAAGYSNVAEMNDLLGLEGL